MGVRRLYKVTSPYVHTAVKELDYSQTADVQYLVHRGYDPFKLERSSHTDWDFTQVTFGPLIAAPRRVMASYPATMASHSDCASTCGRDAAIDNAAGTMNAPGVVIDAR